MDVDFSGILSRVKLQPDKPETCPMAKPGERCRHGWHERDRGASPCPLGRYRSERVRLTNELALCGYGPKETDEIGPWLYDCVNPARDSATLGAAGVANLRHVLARWKAIRLATAGGPQHVSLIGGTGTAKTMLSLSLYFAWLHDGASCHWIEQGELIRQAKNLHSGLAGVPEIAESWLATVRRYKVLFLSDLGSQRADKSAEGGSSVLANLLLSLLNSFSGRLVWDCNLDAIQMRKHPDIGPRIYSRLCADRNGAPMDLLVLDGADQRQHLLRGKAR